jgi:hypothetical protein
MKRCAIARRVRDFAEKELAPVITDLWARDEFPREMNTLIVGKHITGL